MATVGSEQVHVVPEQPALGEDVQISGGAFHGLKAVVTRVLPARQRVAVLLEFLGRQTTVEVGLANLIREGDQRRNVV